MYGHEAGGLTGFTLRPLAVKRWALWACISAASYVVIWLRWKTSKITRVTIYKEEAPGMIANDTSDRKKIYDALQVTLLILHQTPTNLASWISSQVFMLRTRLMLMNRSRLEENRWWNLNMDGQQASTRHYQTRWPYRLQPERAWSWMCYANGTVEDSLINFMGTIKYHLELCDVYMIFGRYINNSTKQMTRSSRSGNEGNRKHQLGLHTTLPEQKMFLKIGYNKTQLIDLVCQYLMNHIVNNHTKLVITGKDPTPVQVWNHTTCQRPDQKTNHEEADHRHT